MRSQPTACAAILCAALATAAVASDLASARVDLHAHVTMHEAMGPLFQGHPAANVLAASADAAWTNQLELAGLRRANIQLIVAAVWPPFPTRVGRSGLGAAVDQLRRLRRWASRHPEFAVVADAQHARAAMAQGRIALLPSVEGGEGIRTVSDLDVLFAEGARSLALVHFADGPLGHAAPGQGGPIPHAWLADDDGGLSALGRAAVQRMFALGMVVDLAHANDRTMQDVLELAERAGAPVIHSHAGEDSLRPRNLDDAIAMRVARSRGLVGIAVYRFDRHPTADDERWPGFAPGTCDDAIAHWLHYAKVVGEEQVVLGSDFNSIIRRGRPGGSCPDGIRHSGDLAALFNALKARGIKDAALEGTAARALDVFERAAALADPRAVAAARRMLGSFDEPLLDAPL